MICPICHGQGTTGLIAAGGQPQRCGICGGSGQVADLRGIEELRENCNAFAQQLVGIVLVMPWWHLLLPGVWSAVKRCAQEAWDTGMELRRLEAEGFRFTGDVAVRTTPEPPDQE